MDENGIKRGTLDEIEQDQHKGRGLDKVSVSAHPLLQLRVAARPDPDFDGKSALTDPHVQHRKQQPTKSCVDSCNHRDLLVFIRYSRLKDRLQRFTNLFQKRTVIFRLTH
jgi:hypothetical protein